MPEQPEAERHKLDQLKAELPMLSDAALIELLVAIRHEHAVRIMHGAGGKPFVHLKEKE